MMEIATFFLVIMGGWLMGVFWCYHGLFVLIKEDRSITIGGEEYRLVPSDEYNAMLRSNRQSACNPEE